MNLAQYQHYVACFNRLLNGSLRGGNYVVAELFGSLPFKGRAGVGMGFG